MASSREIARADRNRARLVAVASRIRAVRLVGDHMGGADDRIRRVPYVVVNNLIRGDGAWAKLPGDPTASRIPVLGRSQKVARIKIDTALAREHIIGDKHIRPAIARRFGEAAVATALTDEETEAVLKQGYYDTPLERDELVTTLGLVSTNPNYLLAFEGMASTGEVIDFAQYPANGIIY